MAQTITIEPITRIEGHGKVTIQLDDAGLVSDAKFQVVEFRGFEKFCVGRTFPEMPGITMRICGICPISHMLASAKACDGILGARIPPAANKLRRLINHAQYTQSHALSFFHLSAPDLLLGMESDPATPQRSRADPEVPGPCGKRREAASIRSEYHPNAWRKVRSSAMGRSRRSA